MFERCMECTGERREACDRRWSNFAQLTVKAAAALEDFQLKDDLVGVQKVEEILTEAGTRFDDAQRSMGCTFIDPLSAIERLTVEIQLHSWENPLPPENSTL